jgi:hypothetical protein
MEGLVPIKTMQSSFVGTRAMIHFDISRMSPTGSQSSLNATTDLGSKNPWKEALLVPGAREPFLRQYQRALEPFGLTQGLDR